MDSSNGFKEDSKGKGQGQAGKSSSVDASSGGKPDGGAGSGATAGSASQSKAGAGGGASSAGKASGATGAGDQFPENEMRGQVQKGTGNLASKVFPRSEGHVASEAVPHEREEKPKRYPRAEGDAPMLLLISGSPRKRNCVSLLEIIERGAREYGVRTQHFMLCEKRIDPCTGCDGCAQTGVCVLANRTTPDGRFVDDYLELTGLLDRCDGLAVIAPVYFSGPTAQLKALYDRFQPYWVRKYLLGQPFPERRPSQLFVVGAGGDPHGYEPLVTISRSCLQIAGFELEKTNNFVGYVAPRYVPARPTPEQAEHMNAKELADAHAAVDVQEAFQRRALEAGRSFGRTLRVAAEKAAAAEAAEQAEAESIAAGNISAEGMPAAGSAQAGQVAGAAGEVAGPGTADGSASGGSRSAGAAGQPAGGPQPAGEKA